MSPASYIDPRVFDRQAAGETIRAAIEGLESADARDQRLRERTEAAVIDLLEEERHEEAAA